MQIEEYHTQLETSSRSNGTVDRRKSDLRVFATWCEDNDIDPSQAGLEEIQSYLGHMANDGYSDNSIDGAYYSLKGYYDEIYPIDESPFDSSRLDKQSYLGDNSGSAAERKKRTEKEDIKYISESEKDQLKAHAPNPKMKNELLIELMWQTGIRQSEAVLIELSDIDKEKRQIDIFAPKTGDYRTVYYQPSLDIALEQYINGGYRDRFTSAENSSYLFVSRKGPKMKPKSVNIMVRQAADNAEIQEITGENKNGPIHKITSHAIRHGHAVHSLKSGIDISYIKEHMGHSDISTTQVYLDLIDTDIRDEYQSRFSA